MRFLIRRNKSTHVEKIATFHERLENISKLTDPAEKALLLKRLGQEARQHFYPLEDRMHGVVAAVGIPTFVLSLVLLGAGPVGIGIWAGGGLIAAAAYKRLKHHEGACATICGPAQAQIDEITERGGLSELAASPYLGDALRGFPALKERFDAAARAELYRAALSAEPPSEENHIQSLAAPKKLASGFRL